MTISGATSESDPSGDRGEIARALRDALREGCAGSTRQVALILDSLAHGREAIILGTLNLSEGTKLDEVVAYSGSDGRWHWTGDMKLDLVEDV